MPPILKGYWCNRD